MEFAIINIGLSLVIGIIFILSAVILEKYPPTDINAVFGYRTRRSMKNIDLWNAGNKYSAEIMKKNGYYVIVIGSVISLLFKSPFTMFAIVVLMIGLIIYMIIKVEKKLKVLEE
ncbi:SdpI family protein [Heyndrickxia sp. NPDC080065]|uniref:SdpI family protein n=1 Tax=Heyndrickxia sp. NPDC080065 TaxID=3390568 RepID=UPI003D03A1C9